MEMAGGAYEERLENSKLASAWFAQRLARKSDHV